MTTAILTETEKGGLPHLRATSSNRVRLNATKDPVIEDWICVKETENSVLQESVKTKEDAMLWLIEKCDLLESADYQRSPEQY